MLSVHIFVKSSVYRANIAELLSVKKEGFIYSKQALDCLSGVKPQDVYHDLGCPVVPHGWYG